MKSFSRAICVIIVFLISTGIQATGSEKSRFSRASQLPDLSGLAWLGGNRLLAVHDAKAVDEPGRPRASLLRLPEDLKGVRYKSYPIVWDGKKSNDLESASSIPGTSQILLAESGDSGEGTRRIFRAAMRGDSLRIQTAVEWPVPICNIEAMAVARLELESEPVFVFLYAERNSPGIDCNPVDFTTTELGWARFYPETMRFDEFRYLSFDNPDPANTNRPIVGLDVDSDGNIYSVAAFDPETAGYRDPDNGPFRSSVWMIGQVDLNNENNPEVTLLEPSLVGLIDGFKVESVVVRSSLDSDLEVFVGTDDENYGGVLRLLPPPADS